MMTTFKQRLMNLGLALIFVISLNLAAQTVLAQEIPATNEGGY